MHSLGHYQIRSELGRGGMGVVYKAYEPSLNRHVAIKVLARSLAHDESVRERFLREARSMAALNDPHIIQIFFIGEEAGQTYFVMELVDGISLGALIKHEAKLSTEQAAKAIYQTACGLAVAHDNGVIHRDIKPGNLMVTTRGNIKIADFGIALTTQDFSKKLTSSGEFVGTPGYLSPEVCLNKPVDQRSDIFSLGVVLFESLTGHMPFKDESPLGLMLEVVTADIPDVRTLNTQVDRELSRILAKMIAKNPPDRYQTCHELVSDLASHPLVAKGGDMPLPKDMAAPVVSSRLETLVSARHDVPRTALTPRPMGTKLASRFPSVTGDALVLPDLGAPPSQVSAATGMRARSGVGRAAALAAITIGLVAVSASAYLGRSTLFSTLTAASITSANTDSDVPKSASVADIQSESSSKNNSKIASSDARTASSDDHETSAVMTSLEDPNEVPDDAMWLSDVPDDFLSANAFATSANDLPPFAFQLAQTNGAYTGPNAYPPATWLLGSEPVAWHFGLNAGYGFGWFGYGVPRQIYIGPLRQVAFVGTRPTLQITEGTTALPPVHREVINSNVSPAGNTLMPRTLAYSKAPTLPTQAFESRELPVRGIHRGALTPADRSERNIVNQQGVRLAERSQVRRAGALPQNNQRPAVARPLHSGHVEATARVEKHHP